MREQKWFQTEAFRYSLFGCMFGCLFPVIGTLFEMLRLDMEITLNNVIQAQVSNPILFIVDTAPFFLGLFALVGGRNQDKLIIRNQEIIRISDAKAEFFANMSHEIRTPMNGVIGIINILKTSKPLSETQKKYINILWNSSIDMITIIDDLLDFSELEAHKTTVIYATCKLETIINDEIILLSELAKGKQNSVELVMDKEIPEYLELGEARLKQVLRNLLSNAFKYTENGKITVKTSLLRTVDNAYTIKIEIIDDGIGISDSDQKNLFNPFRQFNRSSSKQIRGSGLGLSIAKRLTHLMNGEIGVKSKLSEGSNFWFTFDAYKAKNQVSNVEEGFDTEKLLHKLRSKKVLVVDDSKVNLLVAEKSLIKLKCKVDTALSGQEAIDKFDKNSYDLILMDVQMSEMNGIEAAKQIRLRNKVIPPIIAFSASALEDDKLRFISQGMDDFISKPFLPKTLQNLLIKWLALKN